MKNADRAEEYFPCFGASIHIDAHYDTELRLPPNWKKLKAGWNQIAQDRRTTKCQPTPNDIWLLWPVVWNDATMYTATIQPFLQQ